MHVLPRQAGSTPAWAGARGNARPAGRRKTPHFTEGVTIMESNAENVNVTHTGYRSKYLKTKVDDKHLVVVKVTSPYQEDAKTPFLKK